MSATYRIELRRDPHSSLVPWDACVYRLSDDERVTIVVGKTPYSAMASARQWVAIEESEDGVTKGESDFNGLTVYVDDQGRDAEAPQSVKVP